VPFSVFFSKCDEMSKKACSDYDAVKEKTRGRESKFYCKKCGEHVIKEKWACKPKKI
jgi:hypothetical protein